MYLPHMKTKAKGHFVRILRDAGLVPGEKINMNYFSPLDFPLQWFGPLYNSGPGVEGVRFFKLTKFLGGTQRGAS